MLTHVVLFTLHDKARIDETAQILRGMEGQIPSLKGIEVGIEALLSERSADLCLITRFEDREGLDAYQVHPAHREVLEHMQTVVERAVKVDYLTPAG